MEHDPRLMAIGAVASNGVNCEIATWNILVGFVASDETAAKIAVSGLSWSQMINQIRKFATVLNDCAEKDLLNDWVNLANEARIARNGVIHSIWALPDEESGITNRLNLRPDGALRVQQQELVDVQKTAALLAKVWRDHLTLRQALSSLPQWYGATHSSKFSD
jgi:hypothetical protein